MFVVVKGIKGKHVNKQSAELEDTAFMSSKKKKQQSSWVQCDNCGAILNEKDVTLHARHCLSGEDDNGPPYIRQDFLYCHVDSFTKADSPLPFQEAKDLSNFVLLSQAALQMCGIPIGDSVVITVGSSERYVRKAWKGHDRLLLTAQLFTDDALLKLVSDKVVSIGPLPHVLPCREIIFTTETVELNQKALSYLKRANANMICTVSNQFTIVDYGKESVGIITKIIPCTGAYEINKFYKALPDTVWRQDCKDTEDSRQSCSLDNVGGMKELIQEIEEVLKVIILPESPFPAMFQTRGIILHGLSGTGKSLLMKAITTKWSSLPYPFRHVQLNNVTGTLDKLLDEGFNQTWLNAPTLLTIDDLDVLCSQRKSIADSERHPSSVLASFFDRLSFHRNRPILILATCKDVNKVDKALRRPGRFGKEFEVCVPNPSERLEVLHVLLTGVPHKLNEANLKAIADNAHGFVGADLVVLVSRAVSLATRNDRNYLENNDLLRALAIVKPSALKEIMVQVPDVKWEDIGGQNDLKHLLKQAIEWPLKYSESFARLGISPPRGVLMYGPPGCSKTMIAKALATESGLNFISVKGPELFSKWVGESEKAVRDVFRKARQSAPCIVFFDELDALAGERTGASGGAQVQERVLAQLLTELDGVEALGQVTIVGATNRPDRIDPALLRPGRLDRLVYVPLPDLQTRSDIFRIQFRKTPVSNDVSVEELARMTDGYSGAEVVAVCHEAALKALDNDMDATLVTRDNFLSALTVITPRTPKSALEICEKYIQKAK